jgi:aspartyl-tRNA(Asn)/glutamyl-tRNA(Gln) amidotransferase subunit B
MRCDVNISLRPKGTEKFGTRIELKNLNSFRAVHRAIEYEIDRQTEALNTNTPLHQETRGWDDEAGESYLMRSKESAHDYRYFPDPDLMPVTLSDEEIEDIRRTLPEMPDAMRERFQKDYQLTAYDAGVIVADREIARWFDQAAARAQNPKLVANWIISELMRELSNAKISIDECRITPENLAALTDIIAKGTISGKQGKEVFAEMFASGEAPAKIVEAKGMSQVSDSGAIAGFVAEAIAANPKPVEEFKAGNGKALQFLVGQVMKASRGKANPQMAVAELKKQLQ